MTTAERPAVSVALSEMQEARDIHQAYVDYFEACAGCDECAQTARYVGGADQHRKWVERYDGWMALLRGEAT